MSALAISEEELVARRIELTGTFNVRDIGGYPTDDGRSTKWKTVLRGDALHKVDDEGRATLAGLGLRTSLDLREIEERTASPDRLHEEVQLVTLPLFSYAAPGTMVSEGGELDRASMTSLSEVYLHLVRERGHVLAMALGALAEPDALPAIIHCTAGKDRTGVVVALLLSVLGVSDDIVAADFAATSLFLDEDFRRGVAEQTAAAGLDEKRLTAMLACEPELILAVLHEIRTSHGDVRSYLLAHGLSADALERLEQLILEEVTPS